MAFQNFSPRLCGERGTAPHQRGPKKRSVEIGFGQSKTEHTARGDRPALPAPADSPFLRAIRFRRLFVCRLKIRSLLNPSLRDLCITDVQSSFPGPKSKASSRYIQVENQNCPHFSALRTTTRNKSFPNLIVSVLPLVPLHQYCCFDCVRNGRT